MAQMNKQAHKKVTLYFTADHLLSDEDAEVMSRIVNARHRNASLVDPDDKPEPHDYVAGPAIPDQYKKSPKPPMLAPVQTDEEEEEEESEEGTIDPNTLSAAQLREILDEAGVEYPAGSKKAALVLAYQEHFNAEE
jgi:type IV secretory pathway VirB10-like protein